MEKSIDEINTRIRDGNARVVTAEEMPDIVAELGEERALREVDVVTTGTFGAMCSSGAFLNFGHADPPIRMERVWLNDVEAYGGIAAVDAYIGATQQSTTQGDRYGGAHVIEDLIAGRSVELRAISRGTDCYPRRTVTTSLLLEDLNDAVMLNPRNSFQRYNAATNSTERAIHTYMGMLLPHSGNISYSGAGMLSPLANDPGCHVIGSGVPIFLGGAQGMIVGQGTQSSPASGFANLMTTGDMGHMTTDYIRAATFRGYGVTMYVGVGIPLPVTDLAVVRSTAVRDEEIMTDIVDYGIPERDRPTVRQVSYAELKSGRVEINGEEVRTSSLSSYRKAREVAETLRSWVEKGSIELALPTRRFNTTKRTGPMRETAHVPRVREVMETKVVCITEEEPVTGAAAKLLKGETNHLPVLASDGRLVGIVTTYDVTKAVARRGDRLTVKDIMTRKVVRTAPEEAVDIAAQKLERHNISALPVVNPQNEVVGMLTALNLGTLLGGRWKR
ncbi:homocysteine biosynthesis protein [Methanofollis fontis]|uniref:CBS domain-containing protein n=1 Tax=Methanofollis fontis TaxID=2052832 RepID=A0A483CXP6_9EURY|nr:homocysteine biosynthesis protein [Methanofollis fontis]TAJ44729.1 hypothetical protein CUJ86_05370 [Methanofollis fontis]